MEKRLVVAIALSILVLISWSALMPKPQIIENTDVTAKMPPATSSTVQLQSLPELTASSLAPAQETVTFVQPGREIVFDLQKAAIVEVIFKDGLPHKFPLKAGFLTENGLLFKQQEMNQDSISFMAEDKTKRVIKKFVFPKDNYSIELQEEIRNLSGSPLVYNQELILGYLDISAKNPQSRFQDIFLANKEKSYHLSAAKDYLSSEVKFIGLRDQYFCAIVQPVNLVADGFVRKINPQESVSGVVSKNIIINSGAQIGHLYRIYLGPQDLKILNNLNPEWSGIIYFGVFDFIAQLLLQLLGFFHALVHNWGLAIIILSAAVYFILFPLSIKQMRSMKEMQVLQPKIEALRKEYKDNPQRLNKEIMDLYKEHKVNPLGGCLPLLLQMPIFFALYQGLIRSTSLRGAHFLWIKDLSSPDGAFVFDKSIPLLGNQLNVLPILMAIGMFVQQKISMAKASGEAAQQQKMMLVIMPIMFGVIFYQMPSGLVLYWFVNSLFMLGYQIRINKQK